MEEGIRLRSTVILTQHSQFRHLLRDLLRIRKHRSEFKISNAIYSGPTNGTNIDEVNTGEKQYRIRRSRRIARIPPRFVYDSLARDLFTVAIPFGGNAMLATLLSETPSLPRAVTIVSS